MHILYNQHSHAAVFFSISFIFGFFAITFLQFLQVIWFYYVIALLNYLQTVFKRLGSVSFIEYIFYFKTDVQAWWMECMHSHLIHCNCYIFFRKLIAQAAVICQLVHQCVMMDAPFGSRDSERGLSIFFEL